MALFCSQHQHQINATIKIWHKYMLYKPIVANVFYRKKLSLKRYHLFVVAVTLSAGQEIFGHNTLDL